MARFGFYAFFQCAPALSPQAHAASLTLAARCISYPALPPQASSWLGERLSGLVRLDVGPGDTLVLPSAWPHAVSTPEASVAVGECHSVWGFWASAGACSEVSMRRCRVHHRMLQRQLQHGPLDVPSWTACPTAVPPSTCQRPTALCPCCVPAAPAASLPTCSVFCATSCSLQAATSCTHLTTAPSPAATNGSSGWASLPSSRHVLYDVSGVSNVPHDMRCRKFMQV